MYYIEEAEVSFHGRHRTYKVKKGDTLESVSLELGIAASELRRYHNMYCEIPDLIEADFKRHLEFLILAPEKSEASKNDIIDEKPREVSLGKNYRLPFTPEQVDQSYKVKYTYESEAGIDVTEMQINVKWIAADKNKFHLFEINRGSDIYINGKIPDTMIDGLAAKTAEVLYPLKIVVDEFGKWVDIYNHAEIEGRWGKIKSEILDYYEGEVVEKYIEHVERTLESSERVLRSLRSDYFLRAFFNGIHVGYTADYEFEKDLSFPLQKETESVFRVQHKMAPNLDDAGYIRIEQKGNYTDSGFGFLYGHAHLKVNYNAVYFLNSDAYTIEKMNLECNIDKVEAIRTTIEIELLKMEKRAN
ncbi:LysM peptidoglycan-binding domain-containing protein [Flavobacterium chungangense]|uniref:Peptidoglycan-binding protein LysM n=1 Tax=Flavobacterium chungangense TaxID=554283 RepID=A0A6V6ZCJ8_9FLAO|nr:LysM domain-containing protein [Flavobacterium chungangense]CAD0009508.1 peptidoglycan-binding protein LysM [Flavobacterium chungangense]